MPPDGDFTLKQYRVPTCPCPGCGSPNDAATGLLHNAAPRPGDPTVCLYCGAIITYTTALQLRASTPADHIAWAADPSLYATLTRAAHHARRLVRERRASGDHGPLSPLFRRPRRPRS